MRLGGALQLVRDYRPKPLPTFTQHIDETETAVGFVYFVYSAGLVKIGFTTDVTARIGNMSGQSPTPITLLMTVPGNLAAEAEIHEQFKSANQHGEWFSLTAELREDLYARLCPIGKGTLSAAEQEFPACSFPSQAEAT